MYWPRLDMKLRYYEPEASTLPLCSSAVAAFVTIFTELEDPYLKLVNQRVTSSLQNTLYVFQPRKRRARSASDKSELYLSTIFKSHSTEFRSADFPISTNTQKCSRFAGRKRIPKTYKGITQWKSNLKLALSHVKWYVERFMLQTLTS